MGKFKLKKEAKKNHNSKKKSSISLSKKERKTNLENKQKKLNLLQNTNISMDTLVANAETRAKIHNDFIDNETADDNIKSDKDKQKENSLKAYHKEYKKVISEANVVLEIVDARDPLGTRCAQVEEAVRLARKKLVIVVNKADLIPRDNLMAWLTYLRMSAPTVPFKASTQDQNRKLSRREMKHVNEKTLKSSVCVGAELLMSLIGNYCRNNGEKMAITVGVVGLPNVGKSSVINSLNRSKACNVGGTPGITKKMQTVQISSKIKILDSPGVVFHSGSEGSVSVALKNALRVSSLEDPVTPATVILRRVDKQSLMALFGVPEFETPQAFFASLARRFGRYKKGGVPDQEAAARLLLVKWNTGKISYYTEPPINPDVHVDAKIIFSVDDDFDVKSLEAMETENQCFGFS